MYSKIMLGVFAVAVTGLSAAVEAQVYQQYVPQTTHIQSYPVTPNQPRVQYHSNQPVYGGTWSPNNPPTTGQIQTTDVRIPWSQKLLESVETQHDFGAVAALSKQEHIFEFVNSTDDTLNLFDVKASCGCTKPTILTSTVAPGETAKVLAQFQTRTFRGEKKATVTVKLDRIGEYTQRGEVQFSVKGKIRKDVVMTPGEVNFASFSAAKRAQQIVKMKYAGSPLWKVLKVKSTNPHLDVQAVEVAREQTGKVAYDLIVKVKDSMPAGFFEEQLTVFTNDKNTPRMPISVSGRVKPTLEASPIQLGIVKQHAQVEKRFVVRGDTPFAIKEIRVNSDKIKFSPIEGEKSMHVILYTLATDSPETIREKLTIVTNNPDMPEKVVDFNVRIVPNLVAQD